MYKHVITNGKKSKVLLCIGKVFYVVANRKRSPLANWNISLPPSFDSP